MSDETVEQLAKAKARLKFMEFIASSKRHGTYSSKDNEAFNFVWCLALEQTATELHDLRDAAEALVESPELTCNYCGCMRMHHNTAACGEFGFMDEMATLKAALGTEVKND